MRMVPYDLAIEYIYDHLAGLELRGHGGESVGNIFLDLQREGLTPEIMDRLGNAELQEILCKQEFSLIMFLISPRFFFLVRGDVVSIEEAGWLGHTLKSSIADVFLLLPDSVLFLDGDDGAGAGFDVFAAVSGLSRGLVGIHLSRVFDRVFERIPLLMGSERSPLIDREMFSVERVFIDGATKIFRSLFSDESIRLGIAGPVDWLRVFVEVFLALVRIKTAVPVQISFMEDILILLFKDKGRLAADVFQLYVDNGIIGEPEGCLAVLQDLVARMDGFSGKGETLWSNADDAFRSNVLALVRQMVATAPYLWSGAGSFLSQEHINGLCRLIIRPETLS
jgi:hypothetical protein